MTYSKMLLNMFGQWEVVGRLLTMPKPPRARRVKRGRRAKILRFRPAK